MDYEVLRAAVRHRIGDLRLDIDLTIDRWPAVLFGPSGAGKTSLLRIIAGLETADHAAIRFGSIALSPGIPQPQRVQLVTQRPSLFPHLSAAENILLGLSHLSKAEGKARLMEVLRSVKAETLKDRMPAQLSGGEKKRITLARALAHQPKLLLLDEVFAGLDSAAREQILSEILPLLKDRGVAALYVTHDLAEPFLFGAMVYVMKQGRIVAQGPPETALGAERKSLLALLAYSEAAARTL